MTLSIVHDAAREVDLGYTYNRGNVELLFYFLSWISAQHFSLHLFNQTRLTMLSLSVRLVDMVAMLYIFWNGF